MIETAIDLWKEIKANRNFDEKYYDVKESDYIKEALNLPKDKTILMGLKKSNVSVEELIKVFFEANSSYTAMMNDLLNMFQEIGAKQTDVNLEISFEFDKSKPYTIDVDNFKKQIETWKLIEKEVSIFGKAEIQDYFKVSKELHNLDFPGQLNDYEYEYDDFFMVFATTRDKTFNSLINKWKLFLNDFTKEITKYGNDKASLAVSRRINENNIHIELGIDRWPYLIYSQLQKISKEFDNLNEKHQEMIIEVLDSFFNDLGIQVKTIKDRVKILEDYLDLPFWKKRYELYSVWIFKLIYDVIKSHDHKVHVVDGKLIFPFKETHLATLYLQSDRNIFIYCEKKTPLNNPVGKGRSGNIQPDYSFFIEPLSDVNSSILEIECKQYKRPNNDNFARAVVDYSNGRPQSQVFLVNHGDMNSVNINSKAKILDNNFDPKRCRYFASLNSTSNQVKKLKNAIKEVLDNSNIVVSNTSVVKARLTWKSEPKDLDLSVHYTYLDENEVVNYENKKFKNIIRFFDDVQNGFGPEKILFYVQENAEYKFIVEDYNKTGNIRTSGAKLEFFVDEQLIKSFEIDGDWNKEDVWDVCVIKSKRYDENNLTLMIEER